MEKSKTVAVISVHSLKWIAKCDGLFNNTAATNSQNFWLIDIYGQKIRSAGVANVCTQNYAASKFRFCTSLLQCY